ncbi:hypothetical protein EIP91_003665 [Steccherinum ochraceum]|uniref:CRAL-TRIO domain-containing protein n=1 Tax=Steccherinum ochraceum TaxID=92696 RepID=A0A4R0RDG1_9APHY|nr:hypothetical protein EIP91_003665 [Steccherinum ochraceum]
MAKTTQILTTPASGTVIGPVRDYTDEQKKQIEELGEVSLILQSPPRHPGLWLMLNVLQQYTHTLLLPESDAYHVWEKRWLNKPDTMPRYMRAAKWNFADAKKRIQGTLEWRREFKPELISPEEVKIEDESGKILINGFDRDGRPIIYMRPGRQNTETSPRQLRHLVWVLERAKDLMPPGQESLVILIDYKSTTLRTNPSISTARKVLTILQHHYVETLGRGLVVNLPFLLNFFYKGISPFLDPITRDKIRFNPDLNDLIPEEQLDADLGGDYEYEFEHEAYWKQLIEACGIAPDGTRIEKEEGEDKPVPEKTEEASAPAEPEETVESPAQEIQNESPNQENVAVTA